MSEASALSGVLRRDRAMVIGGLTAVIVGSWLYILNGAGMDMDAVGDMAMSMAKSWTLSYFSLMFAMWAIMMAAMMLPSAAPMILLYAVVARRRSAKTGAMAATGIFTLGYVAVWAVFSLAATALQWSLDSAALLSPALMTTSVTISGLVLVAAGLYQWTPLKQACLRRCQSPLDFILVNWQAGWRGALAMGLRHGAFCLGCCWMIMLLLFAGGIMNFFWITGIALFVLIEKIAPRGKLVGRISGAALILCGGWMLSATLA